MGDVLQKRRHSPREDAEGRRSAQSARTGWSQEFSVTIEERIPDMTDKELDNLHANATRLSAAGASKQQAEAIRLLPIIETAMATRKAANSVALAEKKKVRQQSLAEARARKASARKAAAEEKTA